MRILVLSPAVHSLTLSDIFLAHIWEEEIEEQLSTGMTAHLDHLTELAMDCIPPRLMNWVLTCVVAPKLDSLKLWFQPPGGETVPETASTVMESVVAKHPRRLDLTYCDMLPANWTALFSMLPELTRIRMNGCDIQGPELSALKDPASCPNLQELVLDNEFGLDLTTVRSIFEERSSSGGDCSIKILRLRGFDLLSTREDDLTVLHKLVEEFKISGFVEDSRDVGRAEDQEEASSTDSSSEGSWMSGDDWVVQQREIAVASVEDGDEDAEVAFGPDNENGQGNP